MNPIAVYFLSRYWHQRPLSRSRSIKLSLMQGPEKFKSRSNGLCALAIGNVAQSM